MFIIICNMAVPTINRRKKNFFSMKGETLYSRCFKMKRKVKLVNRFSRRRYIGGSSWVGVWRLQPSFQFQKNLMKTNKTKHKLTKRNIRIFSYITYFRLIFILQFPSKILRQTISPFASFIPSSKMSVYLLGKNMNKPLVDFY